jgi:hypothetical protein
MHFLHTGIATNAIMPEDRDRTPHMRKNFARFSGKRVTLAAQFFAIAQLRHQTVEQGD